MTIEVEKKGPVWTVIHNRPEARNAMDPPSADALTRAFLEFDADSEARVAVLYGEGGAFCAGWDLSTRWGNWISLRPYLVATAVRSLVVRWGRHGSNWTSP
jgi:enoyl-CoA hydratase/carnithine racemase